MFIIFFVVLLQLAINFVVNYVKNAILERVVMEFWIAAVKFVQMATIFVKVDVIKLVAAFLV